MSHRLIDGLHELIWLTDPHGACNDFNQSWLHFRGRTLDEELGDGWSEGVHPADRRRVLVTFRRAFDQREPFETEYRLQRRDGEYRWVLDRGAPRYDEAGEFLGYLGSCVDVTDRRVALEKVHELRLAVDNAMTGISRLDGEGRFVMVRPGYAEMLGYAPDELVGQSWSVTVPPEDHAAALRGVETMLREGRAQAELRGLRKDGSIFHKELLLVLELDHAGEPDGHYCFMRDITARVESLVEREILERELQHTRKMDAIGTLASGIAHDFNNLLTAINGYAELAQDAVADRQEAASDLDRLMATVAEASNLCRSLLSFGRRTAAQKRPVELRRIVRECERFLAPLLPAAIDVVDDYTGAPELWIEADESQLHQVVVNLVVNARDAMPDGGRLRISLERVEDSECGDIARLVFEDQGSGMDQDVAARAFDPFFTTKPRERGTGLGLAIVHSILEEHGATASIHSEPNAGTSVTIDFPLRAEEGQHGVVVPRPAETVVRGSRLLLCEDNDDVRGLISKMLTRAGHEVICAVDGVEAMEHFGEEGRAVDLVLLDLDLPGKPGWVCLAEMRAMRPEAPILIVSGNPDQDRRGLQGERILQKPFRMDELLRAVTDALARTVETPS